MPSGPRRLRPYRPSGLYRAQTTPAQQQAAASLREQLIADHLHGDPSAGQQILLGLLSSAAARHTSVANYLRTLPHPWVSRKTNRAWGIVMDLAKIERHVARLVAALCDPSLERKALPVEDLQSYIARKTAGEPAADPSPTPADSPPSPAAPEADPPPCPTPEWGSDRI
jgi:hypothetical protein